MTTAVRRCVIAVATAALCWVAAGLGAPAHAAAYRYWSYWKWTGTSWSYSNVGPGGQVNSGTVIGWRFSVSADSSSNTPPRASGDFAALCPDDSGGRGVVIDYGASADSPPGEHPPQSTPRGFCATSSDSDDGYRATDEHASLHVRDGLVCGIDGYPKEECGQKVSDPPKQSTPKPQQSPPPRHGSGPSHLASSTAAQSQMGGHASAADAAAPKAAATSKATPTSSPAPLTVTPSATPTLTLSEEAPADGSGGSGGVPVAPLVGGGVAAALGGAAFWRYRRGSP